MRVRVCEFKQEKLHLSITGCNVPCFSISFVCVRAQRIHISPHRQFPCACSSVCSCCLVLVKGQTAGARGWRPYDCPMYASMLGVRGVILEMLSALPGRSSALLPSSVAREEREKRDRNRNGSKKT